MSYRRIPALISSGLMAEDEKINSLMHSPYGTQLMLAFAALKTDELYDSHLHGQGHIERVLLLGALIAKGENFSEEDTRLALFACSYHDIGRENDRRDDYHGGRSAGLIVKNHLTALLPGATKSDVAILQAAIATHSMHDSDLGKNMALYGVPEEEQERCRRICWCLKDADNMDRIRLNDLDESYLRLNTSKKLVDTNWYILNSYIAGRRKMKKAGLV